MPFLFLIAFTLVSAFLLSKYLSKCQTKNLPRGSLGYPFIGETLSFIRAQREDRGWDWLEERILKHGSVFKTSLMGSPTVVIIGQAGNKFVLGAEEDVFAPKQPATMQGILGKQNILELTGSRYRLIKGALVTFLKPESLQNYIKEMDKKDTIKAAFFMKKLTFTMARNVLFGIRDEYTMEALFKEFASASKALWSLPINFPGTVYWRGLRARSSIANLILPILRKKREDLSNDAIIDNCITLVIASHDTSTILLSLMIRQLARYPEIYKKVLEDQMDIVKKREGKEDKLTWAEIQKMKYTWQVAQELMRTIPPVFGGFRKALKDTSYGGYAIPKGWQVFWSSDGTHKNNDIFENRKVFDPSRFGNPDKPIPPYAYMAFGGGVHTCIGNEFARVETLTTIHNLVTMYEWSQLNPEEVITRQPMPYPSMHLPIKIKPRRLF
ncbi:hypothetical protein ACB098_08G071800 [Castanea mollissima]